MEIKFTATHEVAKFHPPVPSSNLIPDWYKETKSYFSYDGTEKKPFENGEKSGTIKRCMPVFDVITSGYLILLPVDVFVTLRLNDIGEKEQVLSWASANVINFHPVEQADKHPKSGGFALPKFINYWIVETPKGYSSLFIPPAHRKAPFEILPGIVDTDHYKAQVNFPFALTDKNFEGLIQAGTPIAQVIPFKRDSWKMKIGGEKEIQEQAKIEHRLFSTFFDAYKKMFRQSKEYK
jgi:hypothetical protein